MFRSSSLSNKRKIKGSTAGKLAIQISNSNVPRSEFTLPWITPLEHQFTLSGIKEDGCRIWVKSLGHRTAKYPVTTRKDIFLGDRINTRRNVIWYNHETKRVKLWLPSLLQ